ncbi:hypothetical protein TNCV_1397261 [Trichonephila clavipes]|nr:hypothetical protein TNCV_1397261 [Trichonephila clavipes]
MWYLCSLMVHVIGPIGTTVSEKNGPMMNLAVMPHLMKRSNENEFHLPIEFATENYRQLQTWSEMTEQISVVCHNHRVSIHNPDYHVIISLYTKFGAISIVISSCRWL